MRPTISWLQKKLSKWVNRVDVNKALAWEYARGKRDGVVLALNACPDHQTPRKMRLASPGVYVCDQCQLDAYITRSFEQGPNTGPMLPISHTGQWRHHYLTELRPDLKTHDVTARLKAIKTSEIEHLLRELKKRTG